MLSVKLNRVLVVVAVAFGLGTLLVNPAMAQIGSRGMAPSSAPPGPQKKRRYIPPRFAPTGPKILVAEVRLKGKLSQSESRIRAKLQTRAGRRFDPAAVQADVRHLLASGLCYDVRTFREDSPKGLIITFELFEQPTIRYVHFVGTKVREKTLLKKADIAVGQPLNRYRVEESRRKLEEYFRERGHSHVRVTIQEGTDKKDQGVVFQVEEGPRQRIFRTKFEGNTIASDARLKTKIDSKPGILWFFKGQVDRDVIEEDLDRLTAYYRSLGYFNAVVSRELQFDDDQEWLTLTFVIDEGPRYVIRKVSVDGNQVFNTADLLRHSELRDGDYFDQAKLLSDVSRLRDIYGSQGYINALVQAEPQFFEQPGQLDLVYKVNEGKQYRVGEIKINIKGEHPHTRQTVILNRIDMREGDIIDIRKVRNSERRLKSSQLFVNGPIGGPEIVVVPRDTATQTATWPARKSF